MKLNLVKENGEMYKFVTHTGNAIKGICKHDCDYCYMKTKKNLKEIRLDEKELAGEMKDATGEIITSGFIFMGSSTDMFASNIPTEWITKTLNYCDKFDNKYLFQSKNPRRFLEFIEHPVLKKSVICTTIESNRDYPEVMNNAPKIEERVAAMEEIAAKGFETFVTIEPIMEFDLEELVKQIKRCNPVQVNIGAKTKCKTDMPEPTREQILNLIEELEKFTTMEEKKNLERLTNIEKIMKKELAQIENQVVKSIPMRVRIIEETEDGNFTSKEVTKKFALIKENRPILDKNVYYFLNTIHTGKYNKKLPILTIEATKLLGKCNIVDFEGNTISEEEAPEYLVTLDGQHRIKAFSLINIANKGTDEEIVIPNVQIEESIDNVSEYLVDINTAGHDWTLADKYCVCAITSESKTIQKIHELIKKGFNLSAAAMICIGKKITSTQLTKLLKEGDTSFINKEKEDELLKRAEQYFIKGSCILGDNIKMLSKRYFVIGFTHFADSRDDKGEGILALSKLTMADFKKIRLEGEFIDRLKVALAAA